MSIAITVAKTGGPEVLQVQPIKKTAPGAGQVWIEQDAVGVNYLDITQRNGSVPIPLPSGLGLEGAGRITDVGPGVNDLKQGDRVGYILGPLGSYATGRLYPAERAILLPDAISSEQAAVVMLKGITAHYLLHSTYSVGAETAMVIYGAAGALGGFMVRWAKSLGAFVIGVVSKEASADRANALGCDAVIIWGTCDLAAEVERITGGQKADVVYDGIGKTTFSASIDSLRPRGTLVSFGASSGSPEPVSVGTLNAKGSLFLTRPALAHHASDLGEYRNRAQAVFDAVRSGIIRPEAWKAFPLADAGLAHRHIEEGRSVGPILLRP